VEDLESSIDRIFEHLHNLNNNKNFPKYSPMRERLVWVVGFLLAK
jgi:hypothetical protein